MRGPQWAAATLPPEESSGCSELGVQRPPRGQAAHDSGQSALWPAAWKSPSCHRSPARAREATATLRRDPSPGAEPTRGRDGHCHWPKPPSDPQVLVPRWGLGNPLPAQRGFIFKSLHSEIPLMGTQTGRLATAGGHAPGPAAPAPTVQAPALAARCPTPATGPWLLTGAASGPHPPRALSCRFLGH